jgi:pilus assembly protein CpaB
VRLTTLLPTLDGPPPSLPRVLDLVSERWWGLPPRARALALGLGAVLVVGLAVGPRTPLTADPPVEVAVAVHDLQPGASIGPGDLRIERWPAALAPSTAAPPDAAGHLTGLLPQGAVLTEGHLATGGLSALVGEGRAAVALPADLVPEPQPGTRLELVVTDGPHATHDPVGAARILRADAEHVWVDVEAARAGQLAAAAARRAVAVVVRPHPP